jgi:chemotaxis protein MotB
MAALGRRDRSTNIWPGFVDALATLLLVIIFLLLIFVMAQFFMSQALSGRDSALSKLHGQVSELADLLSLERRAQKNLKTNLAQMSAELQTSVAMRDDLRASINAMRLKAEDTETLLSDQLAQARAANVLSLEKLRASKAANAESREQLAASKTANAESREQLAAANVANAESREKLRAQLSEMAGLNHDIAALKALREELEKKISEMAAKASVSKDALATRKKALLDNKKTLLEEKQLSKSARAELALLNKQTAVLRAQLSQIQAALDASEKLSKSQNVRIVNLGKRLNAALASKVQELSRYRSEFFGRLRDVLGRQPGLRIVGDRFVFQSEVLFDKGSADIGPAGQSQLTALAATLVDIAQKIPKDIDWVLRIDGHTDTDPIKTTRFPSNWELSSARAIAVVQQLIRQGLPANRLVAAGFGQYQPLDQGHDEIANRRNRRIELKLTQR